MKFEDFNKIPFLYHLTDRHKDELLDSFDFSHRNFATGRATIRYINEAEQCFKNFTVRCMTPLQRELLGFVSEGSEKLLNEYCTPGTDLRANYLKHAPCLNDAHSLQKDCLTDLQAAMETISTSEFQNRIPMACCGYQRYMTCARNTVEKNAEKQLSISCNCCSKTQCPGFPILCVQDTDQRTTNATSCYLHRGLNRKDPSRIRHCLVSLQPIWEINFLHLTHLVHNFET
ncbi:uncharacterized protein CEXT_217011 [Caerostris extrusa]|uniref:Uncharacterized protein n=1 Tax=Caerostris extrusa TaxID=172846 RepID=A0AAV4P544_CAEEX|nr:uncharacterized protein CEXT_217011 [Caerostris extrusa]